MRILKLLLALFVPLTILTNIAKTGNSSLKRHKSDGYLIPTKELKQLKRTRSHDGNLKDSKSKKPKKATELKKVKNLIIQIDEKQNEKVKGESKKTLEKEKSFNEVWYEIEDSRQKQNFPRSPLIKSKTTDTQFNKSEFAQFVAELNEKDKESYEHREMAMEDSVKRTVYHMYYKNHPEILLSFKRHKSFDKLSISESTKDYEFKNEKNVKELCDASNIEKLEDGYFNNINEEGNKGIKEIGLKTSIQLALRKYLCIFYNEGFEGEENPDNGKIKFTTHSLNFQRKDNNLPHKDRKDFKFSMYFAKQFQLLWKNKFKIKIEDLIISLIGKELKGFENPAKSNSIFFTSWDGKLFLKSVNKNELDYFLKENGEYYLAKEKNYFKGGILDYFNYFKNGEEKSFLPQLFGFFKFEEKGNSHYFFIQNGLFPKNIPYLDYIFDLKGASYHRWREEEDKKKEEKENKNKENLEENKVIVYKELDFVRFKEEERKGKFLNGILLNSKDFKEIIEMLERDSAFLAEHNIVDYSLLLGIVKNDGGKYKGYTKYDILPEICGQT